MITKFEKNKWWCEFDFTLAKMIIVEDSSRILVNVASQNNKGRAAAYRMRQNDFSRASKLWLLTPA